MFLLFNHSVPKEPNEPNLCEDAYLVYPQDKRVKNIAVVSDGASESYASAAWARFLTKEFVKGFSKDKNLVPDTAIAGVNSQNSQENINLPQSKIIEVVKKTIVKYNNAYPRPDDWARQMSYAKGSYATLLAIIEREENIELYCEGDSLAVILYYDYDKNNEIVFLKNTKTYPYTSEAQFAANPLSFSSDMQKNTPLFNKKDFFQVHTFPKPKNNNLLILLMTDALGAWLLVDDIKLRIERLKTLLNLREDWELEKLTLLERKNTEHKLKYDDTTLVVLSLKDEFPLALAKHRDLQREKAEYEQAKAEEQARLLAEEEEKKQQNNLVNSPASKNTSVIEGIVAAIKPRPNEDKPKEQQSNVENSQININNNDIVNTISSKQQTSSTTNGNANSVPINKTDTKELINKTNAEVQNNDDEAKQLNSQAKDKQINNVDIINGINRVNINNPYGASVDTSRKTDGVYHPAKKGGLLTGIAIASLVSCIGIGMLIVHNVGEQEPNKQTTQKVEPDKPPYDETIQPEMKEFFNETNLANFVKNIFPVKADYLNLDTNNNKVNNNIGEEKSTENSANEDVVSSTEKQIMQPINPSNLSFDMHLHNENEEATAEFMEYFTKNKDTDIVRNIIKGKQTYFLNNKNKKIPLQTNLVFFQKSGEGNNIHHNIYEEFITNFIVNSNLDNKGPVYFFTTIINGETETVELLNIYDENSIKEKLQNLINKLQSVDEHINLPYYIRYKGKVITSIDFKERNPKNIKNKQTKPIETYEFIWKLNNNIHNQLLFNYRISGNVKRNGQVKFIPDSAIIEEVK